MIFDEICEKYGSLHNQFAIRNKKIGIIQLWAWANCFRFINFETNKVSKIAFDNIGKLQILNKEEFDRLYETRNKPPHLFNNNFIGNNKSIFTERQIKYGLIHDNLVNNYDKMTNKIWSREFCMAFANSIASYNFYIEVMRKHVTLEKAKEDTEWFKFMFNKYFMDGNFTDMYSLKLKSFGISPEEADNVMTEDKIIKALAKINNLPSQYSQKILSSDLVKSCKKEFDYYFKPSKSISCI